MTQHAVEEEPQDMPSTPWTLGLLLNLEKALGFFLPASSLSVENVVSWPPTTRVCSEDHKGYRRRALKWRPSPLRIERADCSLAHLLTRVGSRAGSTWGMVVSRGWLVVAQPVVSKGCVQQD